MILEHLSFLNTVRAQQSNGNIYSKIVNIQHNIRTRKKNMAMNECYENIIPIEFERDVSSC